MSLNLSWIYNPKVKLQPIDWTTAIAAAPTSKIPLKKLHRRAEALNRLYHTKGLQPGHEVWYTKNSEFLLPLLKAIERIIGAERDICGGIEGLVKADLQTINAIVGVVGPIVTKGGNKIDGSLVARVQSVLGAERQRLRALLG